MQRVHTLLLKCKSSKVHKDGVLIFFYREELEIYTPLFYTEILQKIMKEPSRVLQDLHQRERSGFSCSFLLTYHGLT